MSKQTLHRAVTKVPSYSDYKFLQPASIDTRKRSVNQKIKTRKRETTAKSPVKSPDKSPDKAPVIAEQDFKIKKLPSKPIQELLPKPKPKKKRTIGKTQARMVETVTKIHERGHKTLPSRHIRSR